MDDKDIKIETSPLSRKMRQDDIEIEVLIYRIEGSDEGWSLEVVDEENASTVWEELFQTDQAAYDEVMRTIESEGIATFLHPPSERLH